MAKSIKFVFLIFVCLQSLYLAGQRQDFPDVLDLQASIKDTSDINSTIFSDFGAWFGYALPKNISL